MEIIIQFFKRASTRKIMIFAILGLAIFLLRDMINLFLLTFIFTYLIHNTQVFLVKRLKRFVYIKQRIMIVFLYLIIGVTLAFVLYRYIPELARQIEIIAAQIKQFYEKPPEGKVGETIIWITKQITAGEYKEQGIGFIVKSATNIGKWSLNILLAIILSLFFLLEKGKIKRFVSRFKNSKLSNFYEEIYVFGSKFLQSFGKVIQAQILISFTNTILSAIALSFMGFPQILGLSVMIFILGLVPVAGVFISLVPLSIIAYTISNGDFMNVIYVWIMIAVLHTIEAYFLNPKFMSAKTELPIFYTFLVLLISEHYMGVWGLIIGIPIFMFLLDVLNVTQEGEEEVGDDDD
ncbi:MAG: AI-2E family transporter [Clostridia bacterium]|nr:AI-2E family transporter [Clostridia bacterium]